MRERLAELEHKQWMKWSKTLAKELKGWSQLLYTARYSEDMNIQEEREYNDKVRIAIEQRLERWKKNWKTYQKLNEETKDFDRIWADKVLTIFYKNFGKAQKEDLLFMETRGWIKIFELKNSVDYLFAKTR